MFSRAAKSVVKNLGQRKCYVTDENIKVRVIGAAEEIGQTLSQYAKTGSKINSLSISNSIPKPNLLMISAEKSQTLKASQAPKVQDPRTESFPQKSQQKNNSIVSYFANRELDLEKTVTELRDKEIKLSAGNGLRKQAAETSAQQKITDFPLSEEKVTGQIWALNGIAAVQHDPSASQWRQLGQTRSEGLPYTPLNTQPRNAELTISRTPKVTSEAMPAVKLWLGDPDCGECPPDRPQRSPCHPPDGPCVPMKKPGYPAKPKAPKKDFCFNCPPKRPCNLNKCPPDSCDGTCGKADLGRRNLLKLNSESQARSDSRSTVESQSIRFLDTPTGNGYQPHHIQVNNLQGKQFSLSSDFSKSPHPPSYPNSPKLQTSGTVESQAIRFLDTLTGNGDQPHHIQVNNLQGKQFSLRSDFPKSPDPPSCSNSPKLQTSETVESQSIRFLDTPTGNGYQPHHIQVNNLQGKQFSLSSDFSKSPHPPSYPNSPKLQTSGTVESQAIRFLDTLTGNGDQPHHIQVNNLQGKQFSLRSDFPKSPDPPSCSNSPKLQTSETVESQSIRFLNTPTGNGYQPHHIQVNNLQGKQFSLSSDFPKSPDPPSCPNSPKLQTSETVESQAIRFLDILTGNGNQPHHIQVNNLQGKKFSLSSDFSKSPDPPSCPNSPKLQTSGTVESQVIRFLDTLMGNGNQPHHIQVNNLQGKQFSLSSDFPKSPDPPSCPNSPKLQTCGTVEIQAIRFLDTLTGNGNQPHHIQVKNLQGKQFCLSSDFSKQPKKNPPDLSSCPNSLNFQTSGTVLEAEVLYQKYPALPKLFNLSECPNLPEAKAEGTCPTIMPPKCPFLVEPEAAEVSIKTFALKSQSLSFTKSAKELKKSASSSDCDAGKAYQPSASKRSSTFESQVIRFLATSTWNGNRPHRNQPNNHSRGQRHFCSSSDGSKSPKKKPPKDKECSDKPKPPEPPSPPKPPKLKPAKPAETAKGPKVVYQKCPPLPKLPKLPECPKVLQVPPKCPPLPKLPKLPKMPECPKSAEPKAAKTSASTSDCPADKPAPVSKGSPTVKHASDQIDHPKGSFCCSTVPEKSDQKPTKKKGLWDKIRDATKREMSTYALKNPTPFKASSPGNQKRHLWTCSTSCSSFSSKTDPPSSDSHPPWNSRKCKTVEEVCGEVVDPKLKALECKPVDCPKDNNTSCYPEKPRCAEVRPPPQKRSEADKMLPSGKKNVQRTPAEKMAYKKTECLQIKLLEAGPCPASPMKVCKDETATKASSHPLPKPPAPPVHLCRCQPPPKLHPGSCPCHDEPESSPHILTEPCPAKPKFCPTPQVYYCPAIKAGEKEEKVCQDNKKTNKA